ncbi:hypothetical protein, unlikely [Trypanosoma brucei gambiense DAL972]|uniref:Uncharacterized protein n=1 Tax=Trypanosoma brucei gambiense (strain MHOM/CI/86/DAL972) TaxID=679716 RepID=C9ZLD2_TRYB9|nr:hypothetical protein, unlikely [Trypanosoma brucei gambiense DAL972]CBH10141.1 hypothetical protein, unlikely [Trypanosoma brucei gambiense DAL972]|eukprot:XP_011772431.1 hypothetical protein, unlikely [Trypanosoma brucei gambiense DAL972]
MQMFPQKNVTCRAISENTKARRRNRCESRGKQCVFQNLHAGGCCSEWAGEGGKFPYDRFIYQLFPEKTVQYTPNIAGNKFFETMKLSTRVLDPLNIKYPHNQVWNVFFFF